MNAYNQLEILSNVGGLESFENRLKRSNCSPLTAADVEIFQMNTGKKCNLACRHCHVGAGPSRTEMMSGQIFEKCLEVIRNTPTIHTVDLTGGAPEMNPNLKWFIEQAGSLNKRLIVRSNLAILSQESYKDFIGHFARHRVGIYASLPDCDPEKTDRQRGPGTHRQCIEIIKKLNALGYGKENTGLELNLVHNPVGAYMPGTQAALEHGFRKRLKTEYGVVFNSLYCLTNIPVGRYLQYLIESDNLEEYMCELVNAYNPAAVPNVMCKNTLSVGWDGSLYDCDFNQMLELKINDAGFDSIQEYDPLKLRGRRIVVRSHCYGCTAGSGSSCQGSIRK
jgi:radical SAM/Cys-rich protein